MKVRLVLETRKWRECNLGQATDKVLRQAKVDVYDMNLAQYMQIRQQVKTAMNNNSKIAYIIV